MTGRGLKTVLGLALSSAVVLLSVAPIVTGAASATSSAPPWEPDTDTAGYGNIVFYDSAGNQVTSGPACPPRSRMP